MDDPDIIAIAAALKAQGKPRADLGRLLGLDSAQVSRLFGGRRRLQRHEAQQAKAWLGLDTTSQAGRTSGGIVLPMPGMVPLYGWVGAASENRLTFAEQSIRGYVPAHPNQLHVREAFALEVADISMVPRYEPGEIIYISPNKWPARNQDCVMVNSEGNGLLKRYLRRDADQVVLYQLNPERELPVALTDLDQMHTVVGRG